MSALWLAWEPRALLFRVRNGLDVKHTVIFAIRWSRWPIIRMEEFT